MNGILVIDKPSGWTSHDVVQKARRILGERRIGHAGTLDPLATGVLVLCVGKATRLVRYLETDDKEYRVEFRLGITTDTLDADGRTLFSRSYTPFTRETILGVLQEFLGAIQQVPPAYSALKVNGVPSYRLARKGVEHRHRSRNVHIHGIDLLEYHDPFVQIRVRCSKGTYIRTLCADIGERLGAGAHLTALTRERSGAFGLEQAVSIERLTELASFSPEDSTLSMNRALTAMPELRLDPAETLRAAQGNAVSRREGTPSADEGGRVRLLDQSGRLIAVAVVRTGRICPETVLI